MYNLLVSASGWGDSTGSMPSGRLFEYTADPIRGEFTHNGRADFDALKSFPSVFLEESYRDGHQVVRVGTILQVTEHNRDLHLEYVYDPTIPPLTNRALEGMAVELGIQDFEFSRTHWAVKDIDLFRVLIRALQPRRQQPRVFSISDPEHIEPSLVSAMMPFHPSFDGVYAELKALCESIGLHCRRADDIWENPAVIQDVVSLIDKSNVVICDCSTRNPNVFYEAGIAHTLGRETILITQNENDIPFDLRHLRYVKYLNNGEGLTQLSQTLRTRLESLV